MSAQTATVPWHAVPAPEVLERLDVDRGGLSEQERKERLVRCGLNELEIVRTDPRWLTLLKQFGSPMVIFLLVAAAVTSWMREWIDTGAILLALLLNAAIGYWQERKAIRDVRALRSLSSPTARVLQDGHVLRVDAVTVVPGDLVVLESGDRVPADLRLVESSGLRVDESMLTGEVLAVDKSVAIVDRDAPLAERSSMMFSGTLVVSGRAVAATTGTGRHSELGEISELVQTTNARTPLQVITHRMEKTIAAVILGVAAAMFLVGLVLGYEPVELFRTAVALIVSAMPEALPIVLTVAMGVGVSRMAAHHAVVRHLPGVETLGSTTIIGSDKTGTLTQNRLTVERLWTAEGEHDLTGAGTLGKAARELTRPERAVARAGALTNEAGFKDGASGELLGDAVDVALASFALGAGAVHPEELVLAPERDMPYEPHHQFSQSVVRGADGERTLYLKGAPEKVLAFCDRWATDAGSRPLDGAAQAAVHAANVRMGADGLRVLAVASRRIEADEPLPESLPPPSGAVLLGLVGMADPPRPGVPEAISACQDAGIRVMMITGDQPTTASSIGARLGLYGDHTHPLTGRDVDELDDEEIQRRLSSTAVAARMTPQHKLRIVELLRAGGETVAVTGDGVNDAPALKAASIGVAMGRSGTDVAREAADLVLTDDNFVTIVHAVEQGRITFSAIRKASFFLLANAAGFLLAVAVNLFTEHPLIFLPVMLLWTNLVTNGVQDIALAFEKGEGDELQQKPRLGTEGVLNRTMWTRTLLTGVWMAAGTLLVYSGALEAGYALDHARTLALTTMVMFNFFNVMNARTERRSLFRTDPFGNPLLAVSAIVALVLHWTVMSWPGSAGLLGLAPLTALEWGGCTVIGLTVLLLVEAEKLIRRRR